jgi:hypothetical protein
LSSNRHESDVINELISLLRELVTLTSPAVFLKGAQVESSHAAAIDDEFHSRCRLTPLLTISDGPITRWRALPSLFVQNQSSERLGLVLGHFPHF